MFNTSQIEISRSALEHNLKFIRNFIGQKVLYSSVVKGNAYGHGIEIFVPLAMQCGVNHFSVFSADEALRVHKVTDSACTIMIMGALDNDQMEWAIKNNIEFFVFELDRLQNAITISQKMGTKANIHIEVETGMNRTGFCVKAMPEIMKLLKKEREHLNLRGLCTHYAGAESIANFYRIKNQQKTYAKALKKMASDGLSPQLRHTSCSAATLRYPKTQLDMVRIGILQYGFFPSKEVLIDYMIRNNEHDYPLRRLISWKTTVMDVKSVKTGEFVGYGTSYLANTDMKIATIPVGYSHGFSRGMSNQGRVLIHGQRVSVVGTVNMNMMSVDITHVENVQKGDEVVLIGNQGDLEISVASFSDFSDQINYELLTRLPSDIPRKVFV
ncbi:MAG: alanine racemase [Saprospiraceae bacterium]|nr:alanine racemase [Saprospiraceae bacterium]MCB9324388.1 alanine racemase [Lewinellaceae bacterium]